MRNEMLNGTPIPYDLPTKKLKEMMSSPIMKDFSLACEALSYKNDPEAYQIMKSYINDKDKYRRLYILKTIFRHSQAAELVVFLENAIACDDFLFVETGLWIVSNYKIKVSESAVLSAVTKYLPRHYTGILALKTLDCSEDNYIKLIQLFKKAKQCSQKEFISEVLTEKYLPSKSKELFDLFAYDNFAKIRILAVKLAGKYGYNLSGFLTDIDGHVNKLAAKSLGQMSFLANYIPKYRVDVSDDLQSAVIYNPTGEHLYIEYDKEDDHSPYMLSFSFQHVHMTDQECATEWIDGVLNERIFAIEYFKKDERRFGGQINDLQLSSLSYELLEQNTGYYGLTRLLQVADNFKVRGWSKKNDFDGYFVEKDGMIHIEFDSKA